MKRHYISMGWRDALFAHWPVDAAIVADSLPAGLSPRTYDGSAWLGIVAFVMEDIRPRGVPETLGLTFGEVNLRTYVAGPDGGEGIYFYNLDAADQLSVFLARQFYQLPYYHAHMDFGRTGPLPEETTPNQHSRQIDLVSHRVHRGAPAAHFDATYGPTGAEFVPEEGTLEQFLVENYRFYLASGDVGGAGPDRGENDAGLFSGDVEHPPWDLYEADLDLRSTNLFEVNGFERPDTEPLAHYSPGVPVHADRVRRVD